MLLNRTDIKISVDPKKVILKYLNFGAIDKTPRIQALVNRVIALNDIKVQEIYAEVEREFKFRHPEFEKSLDLYYNKIESLVPKEVELSNTRKKLLGAYFASEYSIRSAALFNPSIIAHPDQSDLLSGELRFIISLRAVGEGHISSIEFRTGVVNLDGQIRLEPETGFASVALPDPSLQFNKKELTKRTGIIADFDQSIFEEFGENFTKQEAIDIQKGITDKYDFNTLKWLDRILDSNYDLTSSAESTLNERVIFPSSKTEINGMEDVRFVSFIEEDKRAYIGTFTAYDGFRISPQLIITEDFQNFKIRTMYGEAVNDKGFALFPEKINGKFAMIGRQGGVSISLMYSDDLFMWETYEPIMSPEDSWGLVQLGNCGSPIKTEEGWLLMTHAVGPVRKYVISAILLDLNDPSIILKKLNKPLISPNELEREGYVPNVVYSCGAMLYGENLIIPYALSDTASTFGTVELAALLKAMDKY